MDFTPDHAALDRLLRGVGGPVDRYAEVKADRVRLAARGFAPKRTGDLANSIVVRRGTAFAVAGLLPAGAHPLTRIIGSTVFYAKIMERGSRPHPITTKPPGRKARNSDRPGALAFIPAGGSLTFRREIPLHPGTPAFHFLLRGLRTEF